MFCFLVSVSSLSVKRSRVERKCVQTFSKIFLEESRSFVKKTEWLVMGLVSSRLNQKQDAKPSVETSRDSEPWISEIHIKALLYWHQKGISCYCFVLLRQPDNWHLCLQILERFAQITAVRSDIRLYLAVILFAMLLTLKMEAVYSSETSMNFCRITLWCIRSHLFENL
jgi:hypothetical protein